MECYVITHFISWDHTRGSETLLKFTFKEALRVLYMDVSIPSQFSFFFPRPSLVNFFLLELFLRLHSIVQRSLKEVKTRPK
jgi:hypothetical protein